jgi:shikimate kinase
MAVTDCGLQGLSIFLVGMMGAGKSSVGQILAHKLGYRFFDLDVLIERIAGQSISEIFATEGEDYFRELETQVLTELSTYKQCAIATGGGIVLRPMNWSYLHHGLIVWLDAPVELLVQRLEGDTTRPLLKEADLNPKLQAISEARRALYAQADLPLAIAPDQTPDAIADRILVQIPTVLKPQFVPPSPAEN